MELISLIPTCHISLAQVDRETEENALISIKITVDYIKLHRPPYEGHLEAVNELSFAVDDSNPNPATPFFTTDLNDISVIDFNTNRVVIQGGRSFKVLAEIHVFLVLVFQLYRQNICTEIESLIPYMVDLINLQPLISSRRASVFDRDRHYDLISLQLKVLSLIIYIRRSAKSDSVEISLLNFQNDRIVRGLIAILRYLPEDIPHVKKELLLYTRHMIQYDKTSIFHLIDI
ncbi:hypothetical protein MXB_1433 [Myxobolus squamalis]|nr:hypothetical protein MXB_1433 [Myxobolus squamalis]